MKIRCEATGYPAASITWLQNGQQMALCLKTDSNGCLGRNYQVVELTNDAYARSKSYLTIVSTKYPRDSASYTCVATNREGRDQKTVGVSIYSKYRTYDTFCSNSNSNNKMTSLGH